MAMRKNFGVFKFLKDAIVYLAMAIKVSDKYFLAFLCLGLFARPARKSVMALSNDPLLAYNAPRATRASTLSLSILNALFRHWYASMLLPALREQIDYEISYQILQHNSYICQTIQNYRISSRCIK